MNDSATIGLDVPVTVSARAAKRISEILASEQQPDAMLRVAVQGGGCSGFQYDFSIDGTKNDDDMAIERDGVTVLVDPISLMYLAGSEIDFTDDVIGSAFRIHNPNATASCGCGSSFAI